MRAPRRRGQRGFTLVELLVTMVVTIFGLMAIMALHVSLTEGNNAANRAAEATAIGAQTLESLRSQRSSDMMQTLTGSSTATPPVDVAPYITETGRNGMTYTIDVHVSTTASSSTLWRIRAVVSWTDDDVTASTHSLALEILRTQQDAL
jgi:prepilin-type N-terminal cleavage/methylation domain-containing protein